MDALLDEVADIDALRRRLSDATENFEPWKWQAFYLHAIEGHTVQEVSTQLRITPEAVDDTTHEIRTYLTAAQPHTTARPAEPPAQRGAVPRDPDVAAPGSPVDRGATAHSPAPEPDLQKVANAVKHLNAGDYDDVDLAQLPVELVSMKQSGLPRERVLARLLDFLRSAAACDDAGICLHDTVFPPGARPSDMALLESVEFGGEIIGWVGLGRRAHRPFTVTDLTTLRRCAHLARRIYAEPPWNGPHPESDPNES
jgi:hypothetical protein